MPSLGLQGKKMLRIAALGDAVAIREIYAPFVSETAVSFEIAMPSAAEIGRHI